MKGLRLRIAVCLMLTVACLSTTVLALTVMNGSGEEKAAGSDELPYYEDLMIVPDDMTLNPGGKVENGTNENGMTYGGIYETGEDGGPVDLIQAMGTNHRVGYIRASDIQPAANPEAAGLEMARRKPGDKEYISLYAKDGVTVIGEFMISSG